MQTSARKEKSSSATLQEAYDDSGSQKRLVTQLKRLKLTALSEVHKRVHIPTGSKVRSVSSIINGVIWVIGNDIFSWVPKHREKQIRSYATIPLLRHQQLHRRCKQPSPILTPTLGTHLLPRSGLLSKGRPGTTLEIMSYRGLQ